MIIYKNKNSVAHQLLDSASLGLNTSVAATDGNSQVRLNQPARLEPFAESLNQPHSSDVCKRCFLEGETAFSGPSRYPAQSTLLGAFVPQESWYPNYSLLHSEN